jgi:GNAT superfamily N-acetyltransferase
MLYRVKRFIRHLRPKIVREVFYEHDLQNFTCVKPKIDLDLKILDEKNIQRINDIKKMSVSILKKRLTNGDKCFVTENKSKLLSYHWLQTKGCHFIQQTGEYVKVNTNEAVIYHVRVDEGHRGNKINGYVYSEILKYCKSNKISRLWIYTNKRNIANRKGLEKLGFKEYKNTLSLKFYGKHYLLNSKHLVG